MKLYYTQMADDAELEPCYDSINSMWGMYSPSRDSIITYDNTKIDRFLKAFNVKNVDTVGSFPNFSAAFVYKKGKLIDTIYSDTDLSVFAPEKIGLTKKLSLYGTSNSYDSFEALSIKSNTEEFIPEEFIKEYEKKTGYTVQKSSEEFQKLLDSIKMQKFTSESLLQITGIGSASGLVYKNNSLYIIGDNYGYLYEYEMVSTETTTIQLEGHSRESIPKKDKPDFEAITHYEDYLYVFGSGSTEKRNKMVQIETNNRAVIARTDLTDLYLKMRKNAQIKPEDFNIEGVIFTGEIWYFFNRGNGQSGKNIVFTIPEKDLNKDCKIVPTEIELPKINGVLSGFTDAILIDDKIYFLASAENSNSTYNDGEIMGSLIGTINIDTMKVDFTQQITDSKKFEGLTLYQNSADKIEFLLCEDNDTEESNTNVYHLIITK